MLHTPCWYAEKVRKFLWLSSRMNGFSRLVAAFLCSAEDVLVPRRDSYALGLDAAEQVL